MAAPAEAPAAREGKRQRLRRLLREALQLPRGPPPAPAREVEQAAPVQQALVPLETFIGCPGPSLAGAGKSVVLSNGDDASTCITSSSSNSLTATPSSLVKGPASGLPTHVDGMDEDEDEDEPDPDRKCSSGLLEVPAELISKAPRRRRPSWREFAGRATGTDTYRFGDLTRGMVRKVVMPRTTTVQDGGAIVVFGDLQPISENGGLCTEAVDMLPTASSSTSPTSTSSASGSALISIPRASVLGEGRYGVVWRARSVHSFDSGGLCALVMELCTEGDLQTSIRRARAAADGVGQPYVEPPLSTSWIAQTFLGLEHLHLQLGLLFRDLKPANVVLNNRGQAKLADFGLGRFGTHSEGAWTFGFATGSPGYTAPEIQEQEEYDFHADLYSLGVLIWVLLTGGRRDTAEPLPPFNGVDDDWELLARCLQDPDDDDGPASTAADGADSEGLAARVPAAPLLRGAGRDLVVALTQRDPARRAGHAEVRGSALLLGLRLPPFGASSAEVQAWLDSD